MRQKRPYFGRRGYGHASSQETPDPRCYRAVTSLKSLNKGVTRAGTPDCHPDAKGPWRHLVRRDLLPTMLHNGHAPATRVFNGSGFGVD